MLVVFVYTFFVACVCAGGGGFPGEYVNFGAAEWRSAHEVNDCNKEITRQKLLAVPVTSLFYLVSPLLHSQEKSRMCVTAQFSLLLWFQNGSVIIHARCGLSTFKGGCEVWPIPGWDTLHYVEELLREWTIVTESNPRACWSILTVVNACDKPGVYRG